LLLSLLVLLSATLWGAAAISHRLSDARTSVAVLFTGLMVLATRMLWQRRPLTMLAVIVPAGALLLGWWATIVPSRQVRPPELAGAAARQAAGQAVRDRFCRPRRASSADRGRPHRATRHGAVPRLRFSRRIREGVPHPAA